MQEIETVMLECMARHDQFTSVDIANEVKRRGTWVRNRDVADYLRNHVVLAGGGDYIMTLIEVILKDHSRVPAYVYHPLGTAAVEYREIAQTAISPEEFARLHPSPSIRLLPPDGISPPSQAVPPDPAPGVGTRVTDLFRRFRWPGR